LLLLLLASFSRIRPILALRVPRLRMGGARGGGEGKRLVRLGIVFPPGGGGHVERKEKKRGEKKQALSPRKERPNLVSGATA